MRMIQGDPAQESRDDMNDTRSQVGLVNPIAKRKRFGFKPITPMTAPDTGMEAFNAPTQPVIKPQQPDQAPVGAQPNMPSPTGSDALATPLVNPLPTPITQFDNGGFVGQTAPAPKPVSQFAPQTPQAPKTNYGPGNDLIPKQINPSAPTVQPRNYQSLFGNGQVAFKGAKTNVGYNPVSTDVAYNAAPTDVHFKGVNTNVEGGSAINPLDSARFNSLSGQQDSAISRLTGGPNRTELAKQALADFDTAGQPALEQRFRRVGQKASALGRLGAGMTTNDLTGLQGEYERNRMLTANDLARSVAEGDIADRFNTVNTVSNLRGQEQGFGLSNRNELRGERDYSTGLAERNVGRAVNERDSGFSADTANLNRQRDERGFKTGLEADNLGRQFNERGFSTGLDTQNLERERQERDAGYAADIGNEERSFNRATSAADYTRGDENTLYNQLLGARTEERGERQFQTDRSDKAQEDSIRQRTLEEALLNSKFSRDQQRTETGFSGNPSGAYGDAGNSLAGESAAGVGGALDLLRGKPQQTGGGSDQYAQLLEAIMKQRTGG